MTDLIICAITVLILLVTFCIVEYVSWNNGWNDCRKMYKKFEKELDEKYNKLKDKNIL